MPQRNGPRSRRGRSAIARRAINTNSTNGMMPQISCPITDANGNPILDSNGKQVMITNCGYFGGSKKGGSAPSATGFMIPSGSKAATKFSASSSWMTGRNYMFNSHPPHKQCSTCGYTANNYTFSVLTSTGTKITCHPAPYRCAGPCLPSGTIPSDALYVGIINQAMLDASDNYYKNWWAGDSVTNFSGLTDASAVRPVIRWDENIGWCSYGQKKNCEKSTIPCSSCSKASLPPPGNTWTAPDNTICCPPATCTAITKSASNHYITKTLLYPDASLSPERTKDPQGWWDPTNWTAITGKHVSAALIQLTAKKDKTGNFTWYTPTFYAINRLMNGTNKNIPKKYLDPPQCYIEKSNQSGAVQSGAVPKVSSAITLTDWTLCDSSGDPIPLDVSGNQKGAVGDHRFKWRYKGGQSNIGLTFYFTIVMTYDPTVTFTTGDANQNPKLKPDSYGTKKLPAMNMTSKFPVCFKLGPLPPTQQSN